MQHYSSRLSILKKTILFLLLGFTAVAYTGALPPASNGTAAYTNIGGMDSYTFANTYCNWEKDRQDSLEHVSVSLTRTFYEFDQYDLLN